MDMLSVCVTRPPWACLDENALPIFTPLSMTAMYVSSAPKEGAAKMNVTAATINALHALMPNSFR